MAGFGEEDQFKAKIEGPVPQGKPILMRSNGSKETFQEGIKFVALLKVCAKQKDLQKGITVHADILKTGLLVKNSYVASSLVNMYAKCGAFAKARQVLDNLPVRNVVSWSALIAGYAQHGHSEEALNCYEQMQFDGLSPDGFTFACILKACGSIGAADKGERIHAEILRRGLLAKDIVLCNALVDMYAKCGALAKAQQVLHALSVRDIVSWNALIAGYAQHGHGEEALACFDRMQCEGFCPDEVTFACILKACSSIGAAQKGEKIHAEIVKQGLLAKNVVLGTALVDMYAKFGALAKAQRVLDELPARNVISWSALISGYAQHGYGDKAVNCFERMQQEGLSPDAVTFVCILKACGSIRAADKGEKVHAEVVRKGWLGKDLVLGTALVDMYAKCGALSKAAQVLDELPVRDLVTWNALIAGYAHYGHGEEALNSFDKMCREDISPDTATFACILKACGSLGAVEKGKRVHAELVRQGLLGQSSTLGNALVDMYTKCGALAKAQVVFDELPVRNVVSWSALITGYVQHGHGEEALSCFERMQREGHSPDAVTFTCILKACGSIGALGRGKEIHAEIVRLGLLERNTVVGSALVDMYAKCGALDKGAQVLDELSLRNVVSWNGLIAGYAQDGRGEEALKCFERMQREGLSPDSITFACVLNACSHSALVEKGEMYFANMSTIYGIIPNLEHCICMVDLFGRAGHFDKAVEVINQMPSSDNHRVWATLLGACRKWGNVKLGRYAFDHAIEMNAKDAAAYACMSNIYAAAGMQEDADMIEAMRVVSEARMG